MMRCYCFSANNCFAQSSQPVCYGTGCIWHVRHVYLFFHLSELKDEWRNVFRTSSSILENIGP